METDQSPHCDRDLPLSGADQISPPRATVPPTVKPTPVSFAEAAKTGLAVTKKQTRAAWGSTRAEKESRVWQQEEATSEVVFARPMLGHVLAVPYDKKTCLVDKVVRAILTTFPDVTLVDHYLPGVVYVQFETQAERDLALEKEIPFSPLPLPTRPIVFSTGNRIKIRVEHMVPVDPEDGTRLIEETFGAYGKVVHTTYHYWKNSRRARMPSFDFVLEVPETASKDLEIPRVASLLGTNHLFTWGGAPFCYKCGQGDHTKQNCPKPADFQLMLTPPVALPILARAFPDTATPRTPSISPSSPSSSTTRPPPAKPTRAKHTATPTTTPAPRQEFNWTPVVSKRKPAGKSTTPTTTPATRQEFNWTPEINKRKAAVKSTTPTQRSKHTGNKASSSTAMSSASDSEPDARPTKKPALASRSKEAVTTTPPPTSAFTFTPTPVTTKAPATGADAQEAPSPSIVKEIPAPPATTPTMADPTPSSARIEDPKPETKEIIPSHDHTRIQGDPQTSDGGPAQDLMEVVTEENPADSQHEDVDMGEDTIQSSQESVTPENVQMAQDMKGINTRRMAAIREIRDKDPNTPPDDIPKKAGGGIKKSSSKPKKSQSKQE